MKKYISFLIALLCANALSAQDGTLDTTFGTGGRAFIIPPGLNQSLSKTVVQSDGKIVMAGRATNCCGYDFSVARFNADGSADNTFDGDGIVVTEFTSGAYDIITTVAVQPDGKILAGGYSNNRFALARYNVDGSLDNTFNGNGKVTGNFSGSSEIYSICVLTDGRILVGGASDIAGNSYDFTLARYLPDGTPDLTFDGDGIAATSVGIYGDIVYSLAIQSDGKIIAAGASDNGTGNDFAIVRFNANGTPDNTFSNGKCVIDFSSDDKAYAAAIQPDGKIVVAGVSGFTMAVARVLTNGQPDNTFNGSGKLITGLGSNFDQLYSVLVQNDGKILTGGTSFNGSNSDYALLRFNTDGSPDNTFGSGGKLRLDMGADEAYATLAGWNNRIIIGGYSSNRLAVARLNNSAGIYVLPVRLLSFTAAYTSRSVLLQWQAAAGASVSSFMVEHSTDGMSFTAIGAVQATVNGSQQQVYAFEYRQPVSISHFFRLKMVEQTNQITYSQVLTVNTNTSNNPQLLMLQNPVHQTLQVQVSADATSLLRITDVSGKIIRQLNTPGAGNITIAIDVAGLPNGAYYCIFTNSNGVQHKLFVKN